MLYKTAIQFQNCITLTKSKFSFEKRRDLCKYRNLYKRNYSNNNRKDDTKDRLSDQDNQKANFGERQTPNQKQSDFSVSGSLSWLLNRSSDVIDSSGKFIKSNIELLNNSTVSGLKATSEHAKSFIPKGEKELKVHDSIKSTVKTTGKIAGYSANTISSGIESVTNLGVQTGGFIGKQVKSTLDKSGLTDDSKESNEVSKALTRLSKTTIGSALDIVESIEGLVKNVTDETQKTASGIIEHRFGKDASSVVDESVDVYKNVTKTIYKSKSIGVKKLAKKAAKEAGKESIKVVVRNDKDTEVTVEVPEDKESDIEITVETNDPQESLTEPKTIITTKLDNHHK
eukprot:TRINITY_DN851_c0_g1_i1.p1 TRINITY_DN851_c0_g1~~TRINITY_DN851_c0_g1_i1.p1  ORF type:complete len:342 (-),score=82.44 TRINITY_DN851_c0_g1_i1:3-1028(-)